ncbi:hypothetical protein ACT7DA_04105 [Bacillus pacificus]
MAASLMARRSVGTITQSFYEVAAVLLLIATSGLARADWKGLGEYFTK